MLRRCTAVCLLLTSCAHIGQSGNVDPRDPTVDQRLTRYLDSADTHGEEYQTHNGQLDYSIDLE